MKMKRLPIYLLVDVVIILISYYFILPPINITSMAFWNYLLFLVIACSILPAISLLDFRSQTFILNKGTKVPKVYKYMIFGIASVFAIIIVVNFILSPLFQSNAYANRIEINQDGNFANDVKPVDFSKLPLLDKDSSSKLGDRVMGQMPEMVSQFLVSDLYTQINYKEKIMRVTPLEYNGLIKYFTNRSNGVGGYITVDSVTGESNLVKLDKGMKYISSAYFFENLHRKLRFSYPTEIFDQEFFETDNEGNPYFIIPTIQYAGVELRKDISGVVIFNPIDGTSQKYAVKDVPTWVDHVYSAELIISQTDDWGIYKNGFFNSIFGQKNVVKTTEGYNYLTMDDDVYLYTGITSVLADQSNIGFILTNLRTKHTTYYAVPGAEEFSAMASAEGQVQQMKYQSSFPLLVNLNNKPTYLMSLKDNAGLVKMYAFVDVVDYQKVVVTDSSKGIQVAASNYLGDTKVEIDSDKLQSKTIEITAITTAVKEGTTHYYFTDKDGKKYMASILIEDKKLPFIKIGDVLEINYLEEQNITEILKIK